MQFSTVFQLYCGSQCTYPCFPGVLLTSTAHCILSKPLAGFPHNHCPNNGQCERNYYPFAMTIINPRKEFWPSQGLNQPYPVIKSSMLPSEVPNNKIREWPKLIAFADTILPLYSIDTHFNTSTTDCF